MVAPGSVTSRLGSVFPFLLVLVDLQYEAGSRTRPPALPRDYSGVGLSPRPVPGLPGEESRGPAGRGARTVGVGGGGVSPGAGSGATGLRLQDVLGRGDLGSFRVSASLGTLGGRPGTLAVIGAGRNHWEVAKRLPSLWSSWAG
ncbi:hypothetical protein P7K49_000262 [Saguinus oedipus]|uniref:Uncharacterized protein n=1 Tax=Saguinus oedipus TaxID=9490 RepID=A0ABQ9WB92_SAGOE|nr:hypothetical protein P7K49_000262 [Saguinus oedipus]